MKIKQVKRGIKRYQTTITIKKCNEYFYVNCAGNAKLVNTDKVLFLIWNLPAISTCPFAGICKGFCYARKAELQYPDVLPCRMRNYDFSKSENFVPYMIEFIKVKLNNLKDGRKIFFRIHESGDFYSLKYVDKWIQICDAFKDDDRITFLAYTKSHRYFQYMEYRDSMVVRYSTCEDTTEEDRILAEEMEMPIYEVAPKNADIQRDYADYFFCKCESCGTCGACYTNKVRKIVVIEH